MAIATETIVLYYTDTREVISEVYEGEQYWIPENVSVFVGTLDDFKNMEE